MKFLILSFIIAERFIPSSLGTEENSLSTREFGIDELEPTDDDFAQNANNESLSESDNDSNTLSMIDSSELDSDDLITCKECLKLFEECVCITYKHNSQDDVDLLVNEDNDDLPQ